MHENYIIIFVFIVLSILLIKYFAGMDSGKKFIHKASLRNIITGSINRKLIAVKFSRSLGILLNSGVQVVRAFEITMNVLGNEYIKHRMLGCINEIKEGRNISNAVRSLNVFPEILCSMIAIGEETGSLDEMMLSIAETLDEELYSTIERMSALLEPIMITIISLIIGTILISALMPMFNIMDII
jgi:type IV pilus assembly protein PilC